MPGLYWIVTQGMQDTITDHGRGSGAGTVALTGATGFVGAHLCSELLRLGFRLRPMVRRSAGLENEVETGDLERCADLSGPLAGVDSVVHLAARAHVLRDDAADPLGEYRKANVDATLRLAEAAARARVRRFVFISTVKVNGEATTAAPFTVSDRPMPVDDYGATKLEAERGLADICRASGMEYCILRPPLVYGPGVRGNFARLTGMILRGIPLPLGSVRNRRSLISVYNLNDAIVACLTHADARNETFLVSDGEDLSTPELIARLGRALGRPARLVPCPPGLLGLGMAAVGMNTEYQRLCGSLQVDLSHITRRLGWMPPVSVDEGLSRMISG